MATETTSLAPTPTRRCNPSAVHLIHLVYEPRAETFAVHISDVYELAGDNQIRYAHAFTSSMYKALQSAVADVCAKLSDHGLKEPRWTARNYVVLGEHVQDRDYVLLSIADQLAEMRPKLIVKVRFADTDCVNNCCR